MSASKKKRMNRRHRRQQAHGTPRHRLTAGRTGKVHQVRLKSRKRRGAA